MKRIDELEARRRALLARADQQRVELAYQLAQIGPTTQLARWTNRAAQWRNAGAVNARGLPIGWVAAAAVLLVLLKPRRIISWLTWIAGALSLASRTTRLIRMFRQIRALREGFR
jgi:hypothetical protein